MRQFRVVRIWSDTLAGLGNCHSIVLSLVLGAPAHFTPLSHSNLSLAPRDTESTTLIAGYVIDQSLL
jgi:hypothetical protein